MDDHASDSYTGVGALEHLTGPSRGRITWLSARSTDIALTPAHLVHCAETRSGQAPDNLIARFRRVGSGYEMTVAADQTVWVNGKPAATATLASGDMIELGEDGPLSRFILYREDHAPRESIAEMLGDSIDYLRVSRQPLTRRLGRATTSLARRLAKETTLAFRFAVIVALLALGVLAFHQYRLAQALQAEVASGAQKLETFAAALVQTRNEALTPEDLRRLGERIDEQVTTNADRLAALEARSTASARIIAEALPSVVFLQGAYGFREKTSGRQLRHVLGGDGLPRYDRGGQPRLTLDGDGPVAELQYTGTGFVLGGNGIIVTNRHVAIPWEDDAGAAALAEQGLEPGLTRLVAYFPGIAEAVAVSLQRASDDADLALLAIDGDIDPGPGLMLATDPPGPGTEVLVMGYPTGLRTLLVQSGDAFIEALESEPDMDFWRIAERLAAEDKIQPLASRGIIGQATAAAVIYDAETTHGGSGGPVLDAEGRVVAVNAAILPEYGGSNIGVPADRVRALLADGETN